MTKTWAVSVIIAAVMISLIGQLLIKQGLNQLGPLDFSSNIIRTYLSVFLSPCVFLGCLLCCFSVFFWFYALSKVELSFAYSFLSLSYVLVLLFSWAYLGEAVSMLRLSGVITICLGVYLVAHS